MNSASRFYRLSVVVGFLGVAATLGSLGVALSSIEFVPPSLAALTSACRRFLLPDPSAGSLLALSLTMLGVTVIVLAGRSLVHQVRGHRRFLRRLRSMATASIEGSPVAMVDDPRPQAFCAGYLWPRIYLSSGALELLSPAELRAVIAHERYHLGRRDPLRILLSRVLGDSLFFMPVLRRLAHRYSALSELAADDEAVHQAGADSLASALLAFGERGSPAVVVGIARERVDHLLGRGPRWELPASLLAGSRVGVAVLMAVVIGTAPLMSRANLNFPMLLAQTCMAAMAALAILFAGSAVLFSRSVLARSRS